jgi:3-methylfumaryl-CoA hydratase
MAHSYDSVIEESWLNQIVAEYSIEDWVGRSLVVEDEVTLSIARRIAALTDYPFDLLKRGEPIPSHWYAMYFPEVVPHSLLGPDGHPRKGGFLPPVPLPRRMFAGRKSEFIGDLRIGDIARKVSRIASIEFKDGASGRMVFVTVQHEIDVRGEPCIVEEQKIVYREPSESRRPQRSAGSTDIGIPQWSETRLIDSVLAFRFSAITFNGHKIHYDADYARSIENYPKCVMNGACTIHLLTDAALRHNGVTLKRLSARLSKPLFVGETMTLNGTLEGEGHMRCWAGNADGDTAAIVDLEFAL